MRLYTLCIILCLVSIFSICAGFPKIQKRSSLKKKLFHATPFINIANFAIFLILFIACGISFEREKTRKVFEKLEDHAQKHRKTPYVKKILRDETAELLAGEDSGGSVGSDDPFGGDDGAADAPVKENDSDESADLGSLANEPNEFLQDKDSCWPIADSEKLFNGLLRLEENYLSERTKYHEALKNADIDGQMLSNMLETRGGARSLVLTKGLPAIPAGLNLGAHGMVKMPDSIMVFYRMKLRNDTHFTVKRFASNMYSMAVGIKLALNDLHLVGDYDRSLTENDTATLYYRPTFGRVQLLLKDATYMMEGRYRLLGGKLVVEHVLSNITIPEILMLFDNDTCSGIKLKQENIDDYVSRMQVDFDLWLKDYISDYLAYVNMSEAVPSKRLEEFEVSKQIFVNQYVDYVISMLNNRLSELNMAIARIPNFRIIAIDGTEFNLTEGFVEGLDTMYRRSVGTEGGDEQVRIVDADISFSNLKVLYKYDAIVHEDIPQVPGVLILTGDDLEAHLQLGHVREPGFADVYISAIRQTKNESLIVEGAASRHIANYKHLLEHDIFAIMSNILRHGVLSLNSLSRCFPKIKGDVDENMGIKLEIPVVFDALRAGKMPVKFGVK